jgi:hypothetical protein
MGYIVHKESVSEPNKVLCNSPVLSPVKSDKDYQVSCAKCLKQMGMMHKVSSHNEKKSRVLKPKDREEL